jgi:dTMP kinase
VVLEGLDGAGTTTQSDLLAAWLRGRGHKVHLTAEPSRGPVGALIRQILTGRVTGPAGGVDPAALALLFAADRLDHLACEVEPRLASGWDVVSDRYLLSSLAYQGAATGRGRWVEAVNARAPAPDLTVFLEVRPVVALRRRFAVSSERELFEVLDFQRRVALGYRRSIARLRRLGQRVAVVSGEAPVAEVADAVARAVARLG